ncbi:MAG: hypothetical protein IKP60_01715 [Treponema sp.]|nr:hypothetical protein [Treponema sp.]
MKKTLPTLIVYTLLIFAICMAVTFCYRPIPELNPGDDNRYRFIRGLLWFWTFLPAILVSGFAIGCSIAWKNQKVGSKKRFSEEMFSRFGGTILLALVMTLLLSLNHEVLRPNTQRTFDTLVSGPTELSAAKKSARELLESKNPEFSYPCALRAYKICPADPETSELLKKAKDALDLAYDRSLYDSDKKTTVTIKDVMPLTTEDSNHTAVEMLEKSRQAAEQKNWYLAHYWANLAIKASTGVDSILQDAKIASANAWNELKNPSGFDTEENYIFYNRKMAAYNALLAENTSDNLKAYYILKDLSENGHSEDPDVIRFLARAQEKVENEYFFIDEADSIDKLKNIGDVYFALADPESGTKNVYYIKGIMDSGTVRYLEGLTVATFSKSGKFIRSMYAPIAKVIPQSITTFEGDSLSIKGISKSWKNVPHIMLQAVDRTSSGIVTKPVYSYSITNLPEEILQAEGMSAAKVYDRTRAEDPLAFQTQRSNVVQRLPETRSITLSMPYNDFIAINDASDGPERMDLVTLSQFVKKATSYGFSREVFYKDFVGRTLYPLFLLCLMIFCATFGWNYRIMASDNVQFKFRWIFLVPVAGVAAYIILEFANYVYNMMNYVIAGACGGAAFPVSIAVYVALLICVSIQFLCRHDK